jgi:hypothetical protein
MKPPRAAVAAQASARLGLPALGFAAVGAAVLCLLAASGTPAHSAPQTAPPAADAPACAVLARQVHAEGASAVVARLSRHGGWDRLLARIEQGDGACLRLAPALKPGTDAATSEGLRYALGRALLTNPAEVLRLGDAAFPLSEICRDNRIEPTPAQVRRFRQRARAAVAGVRAPALMARRDACLRALGG